MATSESDDFESADEELNARTKRINRSKKYNSIGSDSDDDIDYIPVQYHTPMKKSSKGESKNSNQSNKSALEQHKTSDKSSTEVKKATDNNETAEKDSNSVQPKKENSVNADSEISLEGQDNSKKSSEILQSGMSSIKQVSNNEKSKSAINRRSRPDRQKKPKESLGTKKLGATKIDKLPDVKETTFNEVKNKGGSEGKPAQLTQECCEEPGEQNLQEELKKATEKNESQKKYSKTNNKDLETMPEELLSNLKFKDIFKPHGWESMGDAVKLPDDLSDDKYHPVLDKLSSANNEQTDINDSWSSWGSWGMSSLLNTASAGVSTLTSHVSQGLSILEETMGIPEPEVFIKEETPTEEKSKSEEKDSSNLTEEINEEKKNAQESPIQYLPSFGFGNFMSSVSSITKLVETTSSKVIAGGLDTLEVIGKKTMEVLQEGDPGLKKKRAFFLNEGDKPILSQILREAKEKAEVEEKSIEEKQLARKVHFESLFDDYQGLVHLEALEMLSKQCNIKIQQRLVNLDGVELQELQETLDEVKELCDLGDEEEEDDDNQKEKDFEQKLDKACKDLGVSIKYNKLIDIWNDMISRIPPPDSKDSHKELFQKAIAALAQFTAYCVERFHKTAELLLIKPHRSTVNEADSLVQLTKTLSSQIGSIASLYCDRLNEFKDDNEKAEIKSNITTITLEATNASSYVQEAFRLLIPILQVGAV
ncbi:protein FAM114A2 [Phymastichus coffea]|uniref:protein FAM114A2 n=1 Tax=Phymastichus coffea TaxID=108790 RepID=UPI00273AB208|nr:protein FAM114A2 [Phymastichus coffea]XP_058798938.1 protein FAM114A2 [Phymastichus coffea]XP_058798939.1 protein FAM114A2 [Phymastichus coffea]